MDGCIHCYDGCVCDDCWLEMDKVGRCLADARWSSSTSSEAFDHPPVCPDDDVPHAACEGELPF